MRSFTKFTGKHLCWSNILMNFIRKRLQCSCFHVKFTKFLRSPILQNIRLRLLLNSCTSSYQYRLFRMKQSKTLDRFRTNSYRKNKCFLYGPLMSEETKISFEIDANSHSISKTTSQNYRKNTRLSTRKKIQKSSYLQLSQLTTFLTGTILRLKIKLQLKNTFDQHIN